MEESGERRVEAPEPQAEAVVAAEVEAEVQAEEEAEVEVEVEVEVMRRGGGVGRSRRALLSRCTCARLARTLCTSTSA
jgi:hypothetical protein